MSVVGKTYCSLIITILFVLSNNNQVLCADQCDPNNYHGPMKETYITGLERLIQGFEGMVSTVTGGSDDNEDDHKSRGGIFSRTFSAVLSRFEPKIHAILPGTLWCGAGDVAPDENHLGAFNITDACCRSHDECTTNIETGESYGPLKNNGVFTRSACGCDHAFYQCLKRANTIISGGIGNTYFNILRPQCFTCEHPIVSCAQKDKTRLFEKKCIAYDIDTTKPKQLQWFDNPDF